jgi:hypothetical protein
MSKIIKKTGFTKVLGRQGYRVIHCVNRLKTAPFKEIVSVLDFTFKP